MHVLPAVKAHGVNCTMCGAVPPQTHGPGLGLSALDMAVYSALCMGSGKMWVRVLVC